MANITFNSVDLSGLGLVTPGAAGVHDLAGVVVSQTFVPGYALPNEAELRDDLVTMTFQCAVVGTSHADLVTKLRALRVALSPRLGWKYLTMTDLATERTLARCKGFPINFDAIPYDMEAVRFALTFFRAPWWEDVTAQTATVAASPGAVDNTGGLVAWPVYTCTLLADMPTGLSFTVGGTTFTYTDPLVTGDSLVVTTELPDVALNGSRSLSGTDPAAEFPGLGAGVNVVTLSDDSKFRLGLSYRRRYE